MAKILIIDDEIDMCMALSDVLEAEGYKSEHVQDSVIGLNKIRDDHPDLVLLDIRMPVMDGVDTLRKIREISPGLPVIMITGYGSAETAAEVMKIGARDYISKPFDNDRVLSSIKKALHAKHYWEEDIFTKKLGEKLGHVEPEDRGYRPHTAGGTLFRKDLMIRLSAILAGLGMLIVIFSYLYSFRVRTYTVPCSHPSGITWDGESILICDWFEQAVYKYDTRRFSLVRTYHFPGLRLTGLAWDGKSLWASDGWNKRIKRHNMDDELTLLASYESPGPSPAALAWDEKNIWSSDINSGKIYKHRMDSELSVLEEYDAPLKNPCGLIWAGDTLWSCDADSSRVYIHNMDQQLSVAESYNVAGIIIGGYLIGITYDGKNLWLITEDPARVYRCRYAYLRLKKMFGK